jgi:hypothetical protein
MQHLVVLKLSYTQELLFEVLKLSYTQELSFEVLKVSSWVQPRYENNKQTRRKNHKKNHPNIQASRTYRTSKHLSNMQAAPMLSMDQ